MSYVGLSLALLLALAAGFALTILLMPGRRECNVIECLSLAPFFGFGMVSLLLWIAGFALSGVFLKLVVTLTLAVVILAAWRVGKKRQCLFIWSRPRSVLEWLICLVMLVELGAIVDLSLGRSLGWDSSFNWEIKARIAFLNDGIIPQRYYLSPSQTATHPEYPLFVPFAQLWLDLGMHRINQFWEKIPLLIWNCSGVVLVALLVGRLSGRRWLGAVAAVLLFFVPYAACGAGGMTSGYVDFPLGIVYLAAVGYLLLYISTGDLASFSLYAAALALLPWIKREGVVLWLLAAICGALTLYRSRGDRRRWLALVPGLLIIIAWNVYLAGVGAGAPHDFMAANLTTLSEHIGRVGPICRSVLRELCCQDRWSILWLGLALAFAQQISQRRDAVLLISTITTLVPLGLYGCAYLFSAWPDYLAHIHDSLPRLLLQITPLALLVIVSTAGCGGGRGAGLGCVGAVSTGEARPSRSH